MATSRVGNRLLARRHAAAGFTLVEILVTLTIIAVVSALAAPAIASRLLESPLSRTTRLLKGMLEEARAQAAVHGEAVAVLWSPQARRFALRGLRREYFLAVPPGVEVSADSLVLAAGEPGSPDARPGVVFFPLGGSTGGSIRFRAGSKTTSLSADPLTGSVEAEYSP
jgi:type II secretion system protein H